MCADWQKKKSQNILKNEKDVSNCQSEVALRLGATKCAVLQMFRQNIDPSGGSCIQTVFSILIQ